MHFTAIRRTTPLASSSKSKFSFSPRSRSPPASVTTNNNNNNSNTDNELMNSVLYAGTLADESVVCATRVVDFAHELLESCTVAVLLVNNTGTIVDCNDLLLDLFEYERDDIMHQPVTFLLPARSTSSSSTPSSSSASPLSAPLPLSTSSTNTQRLPSLTSTSSVIQPTLPLPTSTSTSTISISNNLEAGTRSTLFAASTANSDGV